jgi:hypothetical protein
VTAGYPGGRFHFKGAGFIDQDRNNPRDVLIGVRFTF